MEDFFGDKSLESIVRDKWEKTEEKERSNFGLLFYYYLDSFEKRFCFFKNDFRHLFLSSGLVVVDADQEAAVKRLSQAELENKLFSPLVCEADSDEFSDFFHIMISNQLLFKLRAALLENRLDTHQIERLFNFSKRYRAPILYAVISAMENLNDFSCNKLERRLLAMPTFRELITFPFSFEPPTASQFKRLRILNAFALPKGVASHCFVYPDSGRCLSREFLSMNPSLIHFYSKMITGSSYRDDYFYNAVIRAFIQNSNNQLIAQQLRDLPGDQKVNLLAKMVSSGCEIKKLIEERIIDKAFLTQYRDRVYGNNVLMVLAKEIKLVYTTAEEFSDTQLEAIDCLIRLQPEMATALNNKGQSALELLWARVITPLFVIGEFYQRAQRLSMVFVRYSNLFAPYDEGKSCYSIGAKIAGTWAHSQVDALLCMELWYRGVAIGGLNSLYVNSSSLILKENARYILALGSESQFLVELKKNLDINYPKRNIVVIGTNTDLLEFCKRNSRLKEEIGSLLMDLYRKLCETNVFLEKENLEDSRHYKHVQAVKTILESALTCLGLYKNQSADRQAGSSRDVEMVSFFSRNPSLPNKDVIPAHKRTCSIM